MNGTDAIKYLAAKLVARTDWAIDSIGGAECDHGDGHDLELGALCDAVAEVKAFAAEFAGDPNFYSDGRRVRTEVEIVPGLHTSQVWHPIVERDQVQSWTGRLLSDPGVPSPGTYRVTTDPATQAIDVQIMAVV